MAEKQPGRFADAAEMETNSAATVFLMGTQAPGGETAPSAR
jgi:hypothetical protein